MVLALDDALDAERHAVCGDPVRFPLIGDGDGIGLWGGARLLRQVVALEDVRPGDEAHAGFPGADLERRHKLRGHQLMREAFGTVPGDEGLALLPNYFQTAI